VSSTVLCLLVLISLQLWNPDGFNMLLQKFTCRECGWDFEIEVVVDVGFVKRNQLPTFAVLQYVESLQRTDQIDTPDLCDPCHELFQLTQEEKILAMTTCNDHTDGPDDYIAFHEWVIKMTETHKQKKCSECSLYKIWIPK